MHSHNTGRYVEPYGHAIPSPSLMRLANEGTMFKNAHSAAPTCSPSRGSFLTGTYPHLCGMFGLAHRGFAMSDYEMHIARRLKKSGYTTLVAGVEHTAPSLDMVGYDRVLSSYDTNYPTDSPQTDPAQAVCDFLQSAPPSGDSSDGKTPFFLSLGLNETHRQFPKADPSKFPAEDPRFARPIATFPDTAETRAEAADLKAAVREMDSYYGMVLDALDASGQAKDTYVFCFTDHGLQFPRNMCNLTTHGTGVYLIVRGPAHFQPGSVSDALVSLTDLYPTVCELLGLEVPPHVTGSSLLPLVDGQKERLHEYLFSEINYHAAYEPTRAIRDDRYVYIERFDNREGLVLSNVDDTPSKEFLIDRGWENEPREQRMLYDTLFDPHEMRNLVGDSRMSDHLDRLEAVLSKWMEETNDPLLVGEAPAPKGARVNDADGRSPRDEPKTI